MQKIKRLIPSLFLLLLALPQILWIYAFSQSTTYNQAKELYSQLFPLHSYVEEAYIFHVALLALLIANVIYGGRVYATKNFALLAFLVVSALVFFMYAWQML